MTTATLPATERKMWKRSLSVGDSALGFWKALAEVSPPPRAAALGSKDGQRAGRHAEVRAVGVKKAIRDISRTSSTCRRRSRRCPVSVDMARSLK